MNEELKQLFDEDQSDRLSNPNPDSETWKQIATRDKLHQQRVKQLLEEAQLAAPEDFYHAAFILQRWIVIL